MQIRYKYESDGRCFAKGMGGCIIFGEEADEYICGTYQCDFYKPEGCKDWVRWNDDRKGLVRLFPPEEVSYGEDES